MKLTVIYFPEPDGSEMPACVTGHIRGYRTGRYSTRSTSGAGCRLRQTLGAEPWVSPAAKQESVCALCLPQGKPWTGVLVPASSGGTKSAFPPPHSILLPVTCLFGRQPKSLPDRLMRAVKGFNCLFFLMKTLLNVSSIQKPYRAHQFFLTRAK